MNATVTPEPSIPRERAVPAFGVVASAWMIPSAWGSSSGGAPWRTGSGRRSARGRARRARGGRSIERTGQLDDLVGNDLGHRRVGGQRAASPGDTVADTALMVVYEWTL